MEVDYYPYHDRGNTQRANQPTEPSLPSNHAADSTSVQEWKSRAGEEISRFTERAENELGEAASQAQEQLSQQLSQKAEDGRQRLAFRVHRVASAFDNARMAVDAVDEPLIANAMSSLAGQLDRTGSYLDSRDIRGLVDDTQSFGRRNPTLLLGGALAVGLALGRFLKSSKAKVETISDDDLIEVEEGPAIDLRPKNHPSPGGMQNA